MFEPRRGMRTKLTGRLWRHRERLHGFQESFKRLVLQSRVDRFQGIGLADFARVSEVELLRLRNSLGLWRRRTISGGSRALRFPSRSIPFDSLPFLSIPIRGRGLADISTSIRRGLVERSVIVRRICRPVWRSRMPNRRLVDPLVTTPAGDMPEPFAVRVELTDKVCSDQFADQLSHRVVVDRISRQDFHLEPLDRRGVNSAVVTE